MIEKGRLWMAVVLLCFWSILRQKQLREMPIKLSVIVRGQSSEDFDHVRRGIDLAARDYNLDVTLRNGRQSQLPEVEFRVITKDAMHEEENERLLFPFGS